jgi:hypothetical protein
MKNLTESKCDSIKKLLEDKKLHIALHYISTVKKFNIRKLSRITINVPVVFMARYVMVLRGATSLRGALEGVGPENLPGPSWTFLLLWIQSLLHVSEGY